MMRFSATLTRRAETSLCGATGTSSVARRGDAGTTFASRRGIGLWIVVDRRSSSQTSMSALPMARNYRSVVSEHQALLDISALALLHACIAMGAPTRFVSLTRFARRVIDRAELHVTRRRHIDRRARRCGGRIERRRMPRHGVELPRGLDRRPLGMRGPERAQVVGRLQAALPGELVGLVELLARGAGDVD